MQIENFATLELALISSNQERYKQLRCNLTKFTLLGKLRTKFVQLLFRYKYTPLFLLTLTIGIKTALSSLLGQKH